MNRYDRSSGSLACGCASRNLGFTLTELLVVVSIIAVLIAMLLPSLDRARGEAQAIVCLGLHKNFGVAVMLYRDDNDDAFPVFHPLSPDLTPTFEMTSEIHNTFQR